MNMRTILVALLAAVVLALGSHVARAQGAAVLAAGAGGTAAPATEIGDAPLSPEEVRALVARLDDAAVRQLLIAKLDADGAAAAEATDVTAQIRRLQQAGERVHAGVTAIVGAVVDLPGVLPFALGQLQGEQPASFFLWFALGFAAMLLGGWLAERGFRHLAREAWARIGESRPEGFFGKCALLLSRLGLELIALVVFFGVALAVFFSLWQGREEIRLTVMAYLIAIAAVRLYGLVSRFLLAPSAPALRLVSMSDAEAGYLHRQNIVIATIAAFGFLTCALLEAFSVAAPDGGLGEPVHRLLVVLVGAWMTGTVAYTIWKGRAGLTADLLAPPDSAGRLRRGFAEAWPKIMPAVVVVLYVAVIIVALAGGNVSYMTVFGSFFTLLFVPHIDAAMERGTRWDVDTGDQRGQLRVVALRAGRILLLFASVLFLLRIWGVDLFTLAEKGVGTRLAGALTDIGLTALVAYVLWEIARINIDRRLAEEVGEAGEGEAERGDEGGAGGTRLGTLLPLIRRAIQITIVVMAVMLILSALGVNIGPLLAGAGVVGLAVGFGAQALVRDIVSGVFFLIDDAFRVGEYIDVGTVKGTVEKISVRSLRLRHHRGPLHTIPFGAIQHLTNYSRDWVIMKLEFRVTYDTDVRLVKKLFKQIGQELLEHPELGDGFIEPFKSQGVKSMEDSAMIVRGKFMAVPGKQFTIRKEVYDRVQKAFNENGIKFAHRRVSVDLPPGIDPTSSEGKAIADAAAAAAAAEDEQQGAPGKAPSAA